MIINENIIRSLVRSLLFESEENINISELFQPDPYHLTGAKEITSKYTIYDTHGPVNNDDEQEEDESNEEQIISPSNVVDEDSIFHEIKNVYKRIILEK